MTTTTATTITAVPVTPALTSRFFNPLMVWADVAYQTGDMLLSAGMVVHLRTQQMLRAGVAPSAVDMEEMALMGQEKLAAATESATAVTQQLHTIGRGLPQRAVRHALEAGAAMMALAVSTSPAQAADHTERLLRAAARSAATGTHYGSAPARVAQRALKPIRARTSANAQRLSARVPDAPDAAA